MPTLSDEASKKFPYGRGLAPERLAHIIENWENCRHFVRALCRTRTDDPFLTMEVLYQLS
jgi:hypothetical protein